MLGADGLVTVTNTSLALAGVAVCSPTTRSAWLLLGPAIVMFLAYRAYSERQRHRSLEFLYEATRTVRARRPSRRADELLDRPREAFHAEVAEVVLFATDDSPPLRTTVRSDGSREVMEADDDAVAGALRRAIDEDGPRCSRSPRPRPARAAPLMLEGRAPRALLAPLPGETA